MKKTYRNAFFWFIFISTIIAIPILLLYSSGYRLSLANSKIQVQKTGSLSVSSIPEDAEIYLNNILQEKKTPTLLNNLSANEYLITIKKDGYFSWEKTLPIQSHHTTFIKDAILVKQNIKPQQISKQDFPIATGQEVMTTELAKIINELDLSNNVKFEKINNSLITILDKQDNNLFLVETNNVAINIQKIDHNVKNYLWNKQGLLSTNNVNDLLFYNDYEIWTYQLNTQQEQLITRQGEIINEAIWLNDNYIIFSENEKIKYIEIDQRDHRQCNEIISIKNAISLNLDSKQKNLFFQTNNNYWKLNILN